VFSETLDAIRRAKQWLWLYPFRRRSRRTIADYVGRHAGRVRVNIGSSESLLPGWLNGDIWPIPGAVYLDALQRLPFADGSVRFINAEHFIEHLDLDDGRRFLVEARRVLADDGVLRLTTPNLERLMAMYLGSAEPTGDRLLMHHRTVHGRPAADLCSWFNDHMHLWGHRYLYDPPTLDRLLAETGFGDRRVCRYGESDEPDLTGIERHDEGVPWMQSAYLLIVEARKR
jgi:predicted SAM-dependent methyltransferase